MKPQIALNQCHLYKCGSKNTLAERLQIDAKDLKAISEWATYRTWDEEKPHGGTRTIYAPSEKLKTVQRRIKHLLERIERPGWIYSGMKGRCHVDNALAHQGNGYYVLSDISSFYESCTRDAVYKFFRVTMLTAPDVAELLAELTTCKSVEGKQTIPAGSPCSQLLAYFSYREMFNELQACAKSYGCMLTLYVDDLTISSRTPISTRITSSHCRPHAWLLIRTYTLMMKMAYKLESAGHHANAVLGGILVKIRFSNARLVESLIGEEQQTSSSHPMRR